ncbi:MAG: RNase adapter RapZ [Solobacterium sp.]|nr:RNase adapter RapZ [Solobacterium sp.]
MEEKQVVLVSGMSGAGKSTVMRVLEDMGYYCIDNFPVQLLSLFADMLEGSNDVRYSYVAVATSAQDFPEFLHSLKGEGIQVRVLFLEANDKTLLTRYKSTRRAHPLLLSNTVNTLEEAISVERGMFQRYIQDSFITIDTSYINEKELKEKLGNYFGKRSVPAFSISFLSFGYKYGVPMDADLMIDVRFLPNPYWDLSLRPYTGNDEAVYNYVMEKEETKTFIKHLLSFTDYMFNEYAKEGKNHFTIAIGCTGGQHRSVTIANFLYDHYKDTYRSYIDHRDVKEVEHED